MHKGLWIIKQVLVVVSSNSCHHALHFIWILWKSTSLPPEKQYKYVGFKGWFNKAVVPGTLRVCLKLMVAWRGA